MTIAKITLSQDGENFVVHCPPWDNERVKMAPARAFVRKSASWSLPAIKSNASFLLKEYEHAEFDVASLDKANNVLNETVITPVEPFPSWYKFKTEPRPSQLDALNTMWAVPNFALFHKPRYGKTKIIIDLACARKMAGRIDALIVIPPFSICNEWKSQVEVHSPIPTNVFMLSHSKRGFDSFSTDNFDGLKVLVVGVESLSQGSAPQLVIDFARKHRCMVAVDESTSIKNDSAARTRNVYAIGAECECRTVMTGTPVSQGMEDFYSQFRFLDWKIIGMKSFYSFRNRYCIMGGFESRKIVGYTNVQELLSLLAPYVHTPKPEHEISLPDKYFHPPRLLKPSAEQTRILRQLESEFMAEDSGDVLDAATALERMTRYQQIAGGLFPYRRENHSFHPDKHKPADQWEWAVKPLSGHNPKLTELMSVLENTDDKAVIWARFRLERQLIIQAIADRYGPDSVCEFTGDREDFRFQRGDHRFIVTGIRGAKGIDLSSANLMVFYSNSFSYEVREQSEERCRAKDKANKVEYIDLVLDIKAERDILKALSNKEDVAKFVEQNLRQ